MSIGCLPKNAFVLAKSYLIAVFGQFETFALDVLVIYKCALFRAEIFNRDRRPAMRIRLGAMTHH